MVYTPFFGSLDSKYAILYVPALIYGFLSIAAESVNLVLFEITSIPIFMVDLSTQGFYQVCALVCIVGGVHYHQFFRLIFGHEGPSQNPKRTDVALQHMLTFISFVDFTETEPQSKWDMARWLGDQADLGNWMRLLYFIPVLGLSYVLTILSPLFLYTALGVMEEPPLVGVILLITQVVFLAQSRLWTDDINLISPESVNSIETPEYVRGIEAIEHHAQTSSQSKLDDFRDE